MNAPVKQFVFFLFKDLCESVNYKDDINFTLFLSDRGFSFFSAGVVVLSPEEPVAAALAVELALAEVAAVFPSTLDCTHTHKHKAHMQEGKERREILIITELRKYAPQIEHHGW